MKTTEQTDYTGRRTNYREGEHVIYHGQEYIVGSCRLRGIVAPHYRLSPLGDAPRIDGLISYVVLRPAGV